MSQKLLPRHIEYIANYNGFRQQFIEIFRVSLNLENPKFLLAVVDYKKNPRWDSCISIYHLFIRAEGGGLLDGKGNPKIKVFTQDRINIPEWVKSDIEAKMRGRKGQVGGLGDPNIFDEAFKVVVRATNAQGNLKDRVSQFLEANHIGSGSYGAFSRFSFTLE